MINLQGYALQTSADAEKEPVPGHGCRRLALP